MDEANRTHMTNTKMDSTRIEVLFAPAEQVALKDRDLSDTVCVVFDVLRATSTMAEALANGAEAIVPVREIAEAVELKRANPDWLLAGERDGLRITAEISGAMDFDLGNSPREVTRDVVASKTIVMTTTNGTGALKACVGARRVLIGSFLNYGAVVDELIKMAPNHILLVCAGTGSECATEDTLCAGAMLQDLESGLSRVDMTDSACIADAYYSSGCGQTWRGKFDLSGGVNGRRLLDIDVLASDVKYCAKMSAHHLLGEMQSDGKIRVLKTASIPSPKGGMK